MLRQFIFPQNKNTTVYNSSASDLELNPPQNIEYTEQSNSVQNNMKVTEFVVTDKRLHGFSNVMVNLVIPTIKGIGRVRFLEYFAFHLVEEIKIYSSNVLIKSMTGYEALQNYLSTRSYNHRKEWCNTRIGKDDRFYQYRDGFSMDDTIWESFRVSVPFFSTWDYDIPYSACPLFPGDFKVVVTTNKISSVLVSKVDSRIVFNEFADSITVAFKNYTIDGDINKKLYVEKLDYSTQEAFNTENITTRDFESITSLHYMTRCDNFIGKRFIYYPEGEKSMSSFKKGYCRTIIRDIITCFDSMDGCSMCLSDSWDGKSHEIKCSVKNSLYEKYVGDGKCYSREGDVVADLSKHKFVRNPTHITVLGCDNIFVLTNPLTFNRKNSDGSDTNVYNMIKRVVAAITVAGDLSIIEEDSEIDTTIISTPVCIWRDETNVATGDLRSVAGRSNDVVLSDPWVNGLDFFGDDSGSKNAVVSLSDARLPIQKYGGFEDTFQPFVHQFFAGTINRDENNTSTVTYNFNDNNYNVFIPSRIKANKDTNFFNASITVNWTKYNRNDVRSIAKMKLLVITVQPQCVTKTPYSLNVVFI